MGVAVNAQLGAADTILLGRRTYDTFAGAWPDREAAGGEDAAMGKALGDARKIVVSNQDLQFTWRNSEQLRGDLVEAVTALKNEPGTTDIAMSGSVSNTNDQFSTLRSRLDTLLIEDRGRDALR
jgi:dihydrofolate reductase